MRYILYYYVTHCRMSLFILYRRSYNICLLSINDFLPLFRHQRYQHTHSAGIYYEELKKPLNFTSDHYGLSNWLLRLPLSIFTADLREKHVFS